MQYHCIQWEHIAEGETLPAFEYELSLLRLIAFVRATGLYDYVHFDEKYARAAGARSAFMATPHVAGLLGRLLTDWAGPGADIRSLKFRMQKQNCAGDTLTVCGKVTRKYVSKEGEYLVDIGDLGIFNDKEGQSVAASATIALPSKLGPPTARYCRRKEPFTGEFLADVPEFARPLLGKVIDGLPEPARALTHDEIHLWCEALEDWNPLYWD